MSHPPQLPKTLPRDHPAAPKPKLPPTSDAQRRAVVLAQFRYSRFTIEDSIRDRACMLRVDHPHGVTCGQFRDVARRHSWTIDPLAEYVRGELDEPKRTIERLLKTGPAETVVSYTCLLELYRRATTEPAPVRRGYCQDGCGQRVMGKQKYATAACRSRAHQRRVA